MDQELARIADSLADVAASIRYFADKAYPSSLPRPKPFTVKPISERRENDMDFLTYEATLPAVPASDVTSQSLVVTVDTVARAPQELAKEATTATFEVPQGSNVSLSLTYADDATPPNVSAPREQSFVANDTIAPTAPGEFGEIKVISERTEP